jgi:hypothetical protein
MDSTSINIAVAKQEAENDETPQYEAYTTSISKATIVDVLAAIVESELLEKCTTDELKEIFNHFKIDSYDEAVTALVRSKYSADKVEAILCNRGDNNAEHEQEYTQFQTWRTYSKELSSKIFDR